MSGEIKELKKKKKNAVFILNDVIIISIEIALFIEVLKCGTYS